jgi:hypothetical protein
MTNAHKIVMEIPEKKNNSEQLDTDVEILLNGS